MATITISRKITKGTELIVMPRKEYERLIATRLVPVFEPTVTEKKDLSRARRNRARGKFLTLDELERKLGFTG